jgi:hypothetical protein
MAGSLHHATKSGGKAMHLKTRIFIRPGLILAIA